VAGALRQAGGSAIEREAVRQGPIAVGESVITTAGDLPALWVIHAAAMAAGRPATPESVGAATASALALAAERDIESIALPALGTGVGNVGFADCARAMYGAIAAHCAEHDLPDDIRIVLWGDNALAAFQAELDQQ
jgi:O-acetyl-ADP-ribose deacetylase (regulator of RNase III)